MAAYLGLKEVYVKDESYRFGLNAFKVLGGSFAMARYIAKQTGKDVSELPYNVLTSDELRKEFGQATFFTATDGNHGRGVVSYTHLDVYKRQLLESLLKSMFSSNVFSFL